MVTTIGDYEYEIKQLSPEFINDIRERIHEAEILLQSSPTDFSYHHSMWITSFSRIIEQVDPLGEDYSGSIASQWASAQWCFGHRPQNPVDYMVVMGQYLCVAQSLLTGQVKIVNRKLDDQYNIPLSGSAYHTIPYITRRSAPDAVLQRIEELLIPIIIDADIRDAGLKPTESALVVIDSDSRTESRRNRRHAPDYKMKFPLLRLLHHRAIFESPALAASSSSVYVSFTPELYHHLLCKNAVVYTPEIRVMPNMASSWKKHWAESTGEALATIFLEQTVKLDLSSVTRIPESAGSTPDFRAVTLMNEPIIYEAKGTTSWDWHKEQRKKALQQLGKSGDEATDDGAQFIQWTGFDRGRLFACSTFAALLGDDRSSLLHVADPPFQFDEFFNERWDDTARRHHYAAVLQSCGFYQLAEAILQRNTDFQDESQSEGSFFTISPYDEDGENVFIGKTELFSDLASRYRHPEPSLFRNVNIFTGIDRRLFDELRHGHIPVAGSDTESVYPRVTETGILPDELNGVRGIYSRLSDGAFLAIEITE